ncbi:hypothetical protein [Planktotalea sp.]|uniref:hypothetical protein n=1 Tax=Planktotalea sp. TaxID=2029877 RepID=UPI003D6AD13E
MIIAHSKWPGIGSYAGVDTREANLNAEALALPWKAGPAKQIDIQLLQMKKRCVGTSSAEQPSLEQMEVINACIL